MQELVQLEFFAYHVHHFQCLTVPAELAVMFRFMVVGITEMLLWLVCLIVLKSVWDLQCIWSFSMLHIPSKGSNLNTTEQYEIYKCYKQSPTNILNDQISYKSHTLFNTIKHSSHNDISAIPTTMNRNIAASSTGTIKHWKCTWHRKASAKNSS